jgi:glycosyltransferase involved in cell wall biosynthesis
VFPAVRAAIPAAGFWVVGRDPAPPVRALGELPGVVVTGSVADIRPYVAEATVLVVPLRFGAGMRQKILEGWAMERCIVSTTIGAESLDYQDGVNILIADDAQGMTETVTRALQDVTLRNRIRSGGRELVLREHSPDLLSRRYYEAIASVYREKQHVRGPIHVVIDLRWMRPAMAGGIENLSRAFLKELAQLDRFNRYTILVPVEAQYDFDFRHRSNLTVRATGRPSDYARRLGRQATRLLHRMLHTDYWRSPEVDALQALRDLQPDVVLSIPGYIFPDMYPFRNVLIVPDLQHEYHPEFFPPPVLEERRRIYRESIRRADHLIAISDYTRRTVIERLDVAPDRITTIYESVDPIFSHGRSHQSDEAVLRKYALRSRQYLFFPGNTWPHKNHETALHALAVLRDQYRLEPLLVCSGAAKEAHDAVWETARRLQVDQQLRFLGYCPVEDMPSLYAGAAALVFPSLFEGFGIPVLEAMWCDCPVVCSNATSLPEVAGDAALLVEPRSATELATALYRVLTDEELRQTLINRGRTRRTLFSWRTFALETVRILHDVCEVR